MSDTILMLLIMLVIGPSLGAVAIALICWLDNRGAGMFVCVAVPYLVVAGAALGLGLVLT